MSWASSEQLCGRKPLEPLRFRKTSLRRQFWAKYGKNPETEQFTGRLRSFMLEQGNAPLDCPSLLFCDGLGANGGFGIREAIVEGRHLCSMPLCFRGS